MKLFADDGKLYSRVKSDDKMIVLQDNIKTAENWAETWKMFFNRSKCHHFHVGKRETIPTYNMRGETGPVEIEKVEFEKALGVLIDGDLKFGEHIISKMNIANRNVGIIFRTLTYLDKEIFLNLHKTTVHPHLEFATQILSPLYKKDKIIIENVQKRATRLVKCISHMSYEESLKHLGLPTLEYRRARADMKQVYKIINQIDKVDISKLFTFAPHGATRGHSLKLFKPRAQLNARQQSFSNSD